MQWMLSIYRAGRFRDKPGMMLATATSSPIFDSRPEPQQAQDIGPGTTTRSRGKCAGNGSRADLRRVNPSTRVVTVAKMKVSIESAGGPRYRNHPCCSSNGNISGERLS